MFLLSTTTRLMDTEATGICDTTGKDLFVLGGCNNFVQHVSRGCSTANG
jgi:hypothetical protein